MFAIEIKDNECPYTFNDYTVYLSVILNEGIYSSIVLSRQN